MPNNDGSRMVPKDGLSLKELLQHFLDFRFVTVKKRFEYQLRQCASESIFWKASRSSSTLDQAIKIIRNSSGKPDAAEKLKSTFKLDDEQVTAILDSQLYKIAQMEIQKILDELRERRRRQKRSKVLSLPRKSCGVLSRARWNR